jgi:hypothetical protein
MNFRKTKGPGIDNINAELMQAAEPQMNRRIHRLVTNILTKEKCLTNEFGIDMPDIQEGEKV